jgi:hypothetical protein
MSDRETTEPPPRKLVFRFADGHVEPATGLGSVAGETFRETLERVAKELGAEVVTKPDA